MFEEIVNEGGMEVPFVLVFVVLKVSLERDVLAQCIQRRRLGDSLEITYRASG